ncbi:MAG: FtsQ-type POTRA domain-containing protein [Chloroflexi bacterium]|nr:FtsQ-type POTRA domain-containing protein [Chloroflexota bacterium]
MSTGIRTPRRAAQEEPSVRRKSKIGLRIGPRRRSGWRWVSFFVLIVTIGLGAFLFTNPMFYVTQAEIGGTRYVPANEVFTRSKVANFHVFCVDPDEIAARVLESPNVTHAEVIVAWPARVIILVREREPALVWEDPQGDQVFRYWVDLNGHLMPLREELPGLVRIINEGGSIPFSCPGPACDDPDAVAIDPDVVLGAQHLKTLRSNIDVLYYDPVRGLSYQDGRGWRGYFGVGTDMDYKLVVYETLVEDLEQRGIRPIYIDVSSPEAPFYRVAE